MSTARLSAILVAVAVGAVSLLAAPPAMAKSREFQTPSHKIRCRYDSKPKPLLRCDVNWLNDVGYFLRRTGKGKREHVTDSAVNNPHPKVLAYGRTLDVGPFRCKSRTSGLTCKTRANGHGFFVSKQRQRAF